MGNVALLIVLIVAHAHVSLSEVKPPPNNEIGKRQLFGYMDRNQNDWTDSSESESDENYIDWTSEDLADASKREARHPFPCNTCVFFETGENGKAVCGSLDKHVECGPAGDGDLEHYGKKLQNRCVALNNVDHKRICIELHSKKKKQYIEEKQRFNSILRSL